MIYQNLEESLSSWLDCSSNPFKKWIWQRISDCGKVALKKLIAFSILIVLSLTILTLLGIYAPIVLLAIAITFALLGTIIGIFWCIDIIL